MNTLGPSSNFFFGLRAIWKWIGKDLALCFFVFCLSFSFSFPVSYVCFCTLASNLKIIKKTTVGQELVRKWKLG